MQIVGFSSLILFSAAIIGCSSPGQMERPRGPVDTPAFEPIVLYAVKDGSDRILFREESTMYEDMRLKSTGVLFITERGVYFAEWNRRGYDYNIKYKIPIKDVVSVQDDSVSMFVVNMPSLVLTDRNGRKVSFTLDRRSAVRAIIEERGALSR